MKGRSGGNDWADSRLESGAIEEKAGAPGKQVDVENEDGEEGEKLEKISGEWSWDRKNL